MIRFILEIGTILLVIYLFGKIRGFIFNRTKSNLVEGYKAMRKESEKIAKETLPAQVRALDLTEGLNASIGKSYKKDGKEIKHFEWKKFKDNFTITKEEGKKWGKTLGWWVNWRNWVVIGVIFAIAVAYGYNKGRGDTPIQINLNYKDEYKMVLNGEYIHKPKYSNDIYLKDTKTDKILKHFKAKDFPLLAKKLKPVGFILEPVAIVGVGAGGSKGGVEYGAGVSFIKYWKWKLDGFLTNRGVYVGTSYQITDNSGLGLGVGKGYNGDNRIIGYGIIKF